MYDYIDGIFTYKSSGNKGYFATIDITGIGYQIEIMERDFVLLPQKYEEKLKLYTVLQHKEDKMSLCGFIKREDRDIFNILTSVSGVGVKMALTLLNSFEAPDLIGFVLNGEYKALTKAKGVGQKLAQKIILELKDKLTSYEQVASTTSSSLNTFTQNQEVEEAQTVLLSLGYSQNEIVTALSTAPIKNKSAEEILRVTLQKLAI